MEFHLFDLLEWPPGVGREPAFRDELERLALAEEQGYAGAWIAEGDPARAGIGPGVHLAAAWLSARTTRIRIATSVRIPPFFHPLRLAEEIAALDIQSGGRFEWGVSPGDASDEGRRIFREQLTIARTAWTGESFRHDGDFFQIPELQCLPAPVQQPHPPIWIAALDRPTVEWAGQNGLGIFGDAAAPTAQLEDTRRVHREAVSAARRDPVGLPVVRRMYVGETTARAREEAGPAPDAESIVGDAIYCRDRIVELHERIGLDRLVCWQSFGRLPHEAILASQRRLIEKVAPAFD